ncbi:hypothetical protein ABIC08_008221 [Bradyrhizobium sp. RT9b]
MGVNISRSLAECLELRHFGAEEPVSSRDEIVPEILKRYEKLDLRLPVVTVHECMECRVIARSRRPRSGCLLQFRNSECILRSGAVPAYRPRPGSTCQAAADASKARVKVAQHVNTCRNEEIILTNGTEAIELMARRGASRIPSCPT